MSEITLYHSPGACSRVPLVLLQAAQVDFELRIVRLQAGENRLPAFLGLTPKGRVPVLVRDGEVLTENIAIATWIARTCPDAQLMPLEQDPWAFAQALSWLAFGATTLHPLIFRARMASRVVDGFEAQASAKAIAVGELTRQLTLVNTHLSARAWLIGERWMAPDVHLHWCVGRAVDAGIDLSGLPALASHTERLSRDPAVVSALAREAKSLASIF